MLSECEQSGKIKIQQVIPPCGEVLREGGSIALAVGAVPFLLLGRVQEQGAHALADSKSAFGRNLFSAQCWCSLPSVRAGRLLCELRPGHIFLKTCESRDHGLCCSVFLEGVGVLLAPGCQIFNRASLAFHKFG